MVSSRLEYELSQEADNDLSDIYDYTTTQFGMEQAVKYLLGFEDTFAVLCDQPKLGRMREEIRSGLRSISYVSHLIFYTVLRDRIRVVRVLHASRDIVRFIAPKD